ncbi:hypothetical protein BGP76_04540 [Reichenbachiella sp. MSK19-1]|nr:hypothetical protein BGP76_04540 [Reichenbachiella sp. MSK19-1]
MMLLYLSMTSLTSRGYSDLDSLRSILTNYESESGAYSIILLQIGKQLTESKPDSALIVSDQIMKTLDLHPNDSLKAWVYNLRSIAYSYKAQYDSSVAYSIRALDLARSNKDTICIMDGYNNLGIDFMYQEDYVTSRTYYMQLESLAKSYRDTLRWAHALNNLGMLDGYENKTDEELDRYDQAAGLFKHIGEKEGYANTLLNTSTVYSMLGKYELAETNYRQALGIFKEIGYTSGVIHAYLNLAENYHLEGQNEKSLAISRRALALVMDHHFEQDEIYLYELMKKVYESKQDYRQAYQYQKQQYELQQKIFNTEKSLQINDLQAKYETSLKESKIEKLTLENELKLASLTQARWQIAVLIGGVLMVLLIGGLLFWIKAKKAQSDKLEQKLRMEELQRRYVELLSGPAKIDLDIALDMFNAKLVNPLTDREYEVLQSSMTGKTNQEVADALFVTLSTVKFHLKNVYQKLGVSNRKEALKYVVKLK